MIKAIVFAAALVGWSAAAQAQTELTAYADKDGYIDVQKLTCAQLANTFQEDADYLTVWYSGWYNGLAKKHARDHRAHHRHHAGAALGVRAGGVHPRHFGRAVPPVRRHRGGGHAPLHALSDPIGSDKALSPRSGSEESRNNNLTHRHSVCVAAVYFTNVTNIRYRRGTR